MKRHSAAQEVDCGSGRLSHLTLRSQLAFKQDYGHKQAHQRVRGIDFRSGGKAHDCTCTASSLKCCINYLCCMSHSYIYIYIYIFWDCRLDSVQSERQAKERGPELGWGVTLHTAQLSKRMEVGFRRDIKLKVHGLETCLLRPAEFAGCRHQGWACL